MNSWHTRGKNKAYEKSGLRFSRYMTLFCVLYVLKICIMLCLLGRVNQSECKQWPQHGKNIWIESSVRWIPDLVDLSLQTRGFFLPSSFMIFPDLSPLMSSWNKEGTFTCLPFVQKVHANKWKFRPQWKTVNTHSPALHLAFGVVGSSSPHSSRMEKTPLWKRPIQSISPKQNKYLNQKSFFWS